MIFPLSCSALIIKRCSIIFYPTHIKDPKLFFMILSQVRNNSLNVISVPFLKVIGSWKTHGHNSWSNVSQIQIKFAIIGALSGS